MKDHPDRRHQGPFQNCGIKQFHLEPDGIVLQATEADGVQTVEIRRWGCTRSWWPSRANRSRRRQLQGFAAGS